MGEVTGMSVVGTIRSIELHSMTARFPDLPPHQVAKLALDVERAIDADGEPIAVENVADLHFVGPPELVPRFTLGDRVHLTTTMPGGMQIASIKLAPVS